MRVQNHFPSIPIRIFRLAVIFFLLAGNLSLAQPASAASAPQLPNPTSQAHSLAAMLKPDGSLDLPAGQSVSLDGRGYQLISHQDEPPRFAPEVAGDDRWDGSPNPNGINGTVAALVSDDSGNVYAGGAFNMVGGLPTRYIAEWNGVQWSTLGYGLDASVVALAWDSVNHWLYAGGIFFGFCQNPDCSQSTASRGIARWDPKTGSWNAVSYGVSGTVKALAMGNAGDLYVGGSFTTTCGFPNCTGGITVSNVVKWTPAGSGSWSALTYNGSTGVAGGPVNALAWWDALVVGGGMTSAGGVVVNNLAVWYPASSSWVSFLAGLDGPVDALAVDPAANTIYMGGEFVNICVTLDCSTKIQVNHLAMINGSYWGPMNYGVNWTVYSLAVDHVNQSIYVGGSFNGNCTNTVCSGNGTATAIVRWNFSQWSPSTPSGTWSTLGTNTGANRGVNAVLWNRYANLLYVGGEFDAIGSVMANRIAAWNGSMWSCPGGGNGVGPSVYVIVADALGRIYIGGSFHTLGNIWVNGIYVWNSRTRTWTTLSNGVNGGVFALAFDENGDLLAGGGFYFLCGNSDCTTLGTRVNGIARWTWSPAGDTGAWSRVGQGFDKSVNALALDGNHRLVAGGNFTHICINENCSNTNPANAVAVFANGQWTTLGLGFRGNVNALAVDKLNHLYAGGTFVYLCEDAICTQNGQTVNHIAMWTPGAGGDGSWSQVANGVDGNVQALVVDHHNVLFAGGFFTHICLSPGCVEKTDPAYKVAQWNGSWSAVGLGMQGFVWVLSVDDQNHLFAGGQFQYLCGDNQCSTLVSSVNDIARWDSTSGWSALGSGVGPSKASSVYSLACVRGTIFVGGWFATAGDKLSGNYATYRDHQLIYLPSITRGK